MKHYGKLYAAAAAGFMALNALGAAPVFAADGDNKTTIDIIKYLDLNDSNLNAPAASFTFTAQPKTVDDGTTVKHGETSFNVYTGIENGLKISGAADTTNGVRVEGNKVAYTGATLTAATTGYTNPGIYRYTVQEAAIDDTNKANEDITKDSTVYTVDVIVQYNEAGTDLVPAGILVHNGDSTEKAEHLEFTNTLDAKVGDNTLTVTKKIAGNQGVKGRKFPFTITVNGANSDKFKYSTDSGTTWTDMSVTDNSINTVTVQLADNDSVMVKGLSSTDTYSITEDKGDYELTSVAGADEYDLKRGTATGNVNNKADSITFTNTKNGVVPTGILMTAAPYAALVGLGAIFAGFFFRRKRED